MTAEQELAVKLAEILAWPLVVSSMLLFFREQLSGLSAALIDRVGRDDIKAFGFEITKNNAELKEELERAKQELEELRGWKESIRTKQIDELQQTRLESLFNDLAASLTNATNATNAQENVLARFKVYRTKPQDRGSIRRFQTTPPEDETKPG